MIYFSLIINCILFFLLFNIGYIKKRRSDPEHPDKPSVNWWFFPLVMGILFTLLMDVMKG